MTSYIAIKNLAAPHYLSIFGAFHGERADDPSGPGGTMILFGPKEPGFWPHLTTSPEWHDGRPNPIDRWSERVIGSMAGELGGTAHFPFGGPPYAPFYQWALRSGRAWASPISLLVHDRAGLMVSYRGAIALPRRVEGMPAHPRTAPCVRCAGRPCMTACPVGAFGSGGYDLAACHGFLDQPAGADCLNSGCAARRACPVSRDYGRLPQQSAYHMRLFHT